MWFTFNKGRQGTGYEAMTLFKFPIPKFLQRLIPLVGGDAYLLRYLDGTSIPGHVDPVAPGVQHHRVNVVIKHPEAGGEFICAGAKRWFNRIFYFRPDIMRHEVTPCQGTRLVLSFGWAYIADNNHVPIRP